MQNDLDLPVRQAGAIYLKNLITQNWWDRETEAGEPMVYSIHEQDRAMIRNSIVEAIVHAPDLIRYVLCSSTSFRNGAHYFFREIPGFSWRSVCFI